MPRWRVTHPPYNPKYLSLLFLASPRHVYHTLDWRDFWRRNGGSRFMLTRLGVADVDPMFEAFRAVVRLCFYHVNAKSRAGERVAERFLLRRRPKGDATAGLQRVCDTIESLATVDLGIPCLDKGGGSIVDIEENGVVPRPLRAPDGAKNVLGKNLNPTVVQESTVDFH